jgi:hypothetical protein
VSIADEIMAKQMGQHSEIEQLRADLATARERVADMMANYLNMRERAEQAEKHRDRAEQAERERDELRKIVNGYGALLAPKETSG